MAAQDEHSRASSSCRRSAGGSATPDPTGAAATRRTPSTPGSTPRRTRSRCAAEIDRDQWDASDDDPNEQITFGAYAARWLANRQVAGRPIKARTRDALPARSSTRTCCRRSGARQLAAIKPKDVRDWYEATLADRPTMRSHAYSAAAHDHGQRGQRGAASTPTRPASSAPGGPSGSTGSGRRRSPSSACSPRRCPSGCG